MSEKERTRRWKVGLVIVLAVTGFAFAGVVSASTSMAAHGTAATASSSTAVPVQGSALAKVSGPSLTSQVTQQASQYGYTLTPDPTAFNPSQQMTLQVSLGSSQALDNYVQQVQNPASPLFHNFVSLGTLGNAFGVSPGQYAADASYFASYGLNVLPDSARMYLTVTGTIPQVEAAFHTQIASFNEQYYSPGAWNPLFGSASAGLNSTTSRVVYVSTGSAYLPRSMEAGGVAGLSTLFAAPDLATPFVGLSPGTSLTSLGFTTTTPTPAQTISPTQALGGGTGLACATTNYTWASLDGLNWQFFFPCTMPALSGATNLWHGVGTIDSEPDRGQGVTIGIIDVGCPFYSDLQQFDQQTGVDLLGHLTVIAINTSFEYFNNNNLTGCTYNGEVYGWTGETSLDLEYAAAMAPQAHIDLISVGDASLTSFDYAYQVTAQYLTTGASETLPAGVTVLNLNTGTTTPTTSIVASSVSITSNSYGTGEQLTAIFGTPMYLQVENEALDELAATGVTDFFATGDYGPTIYPFPVQAGIPADADGVTSVGGGMVTAEYDGATFPDTGVVTNISGLNMTVAPVSGVASFTYWEESLIIQYDYSTGTVSVPALPPGETGGGFGQSFSLAQPWWQNSLDMYDSGALIDPVISGSAAFNMSIYVFGSWALTYGGTSFATPTFAGQWALVEEQAIAAFGTPRMGEINALLFAAHNAQQAGVEPTSAYLPMTNIGTGGVTELICPASECGINIYEVIELWGPNNGYGQYQLAGQDEFPQDQNLPYWFGTLLNPAGSGWNYLQGLGMPNIATLDEQVIGAVPATQHALANQPFYVEEVVGSGVVPVQTLIAGQTYHFELVSASGGSLSGPFDVTTYSDGQTVITQISSPEFNYTAGWAAQDPSTNGSEYGYFYVTVATGAFSPGWTFQYFAVAQPLLSTGTLTLGVFTPLGLVTCGEAQVPMEQSTGLGTLASGGEALVTLNGVPVGGAVITQTAVDISPAAIVDPSIPSTPEGTVIGSYLSSVSGLGAFWTDSGQLYGDIADQFPGPIGPLLPVVFTLQATYDGLSSNSVTVVAEPESGYFSTNVSLSGGYVTGTVGFYGMTYLNYLNISVGSSPGEFVNYTYTPQTVYTGLVAINLTAPTSGPIVLSAVGAGESTYMIIACGGLVGYGDYFMLCGLEEPLTYEAVWEDPVVLLPATLTTSQAGASLVVGDDTISWTGTAFPGATGTLSLVSAAGSTVLATGLSGSYTLNTATLADGYYSVVFTETAPGAVTTTRIASLYAGNEIAALTATVAGLNAEVASLQSASNVTSAELAADLATIAGLQSQLAQLAATNSADATQVQTLQTELSQDASMIATLQAELSQRHGAAAAPWYDALGGLGVLAVIGAAVLVALIGGFLYGRRRPAPGDRRPDRDPSGSDPAASGRPSTPSTDSDSVVGGAALQVSPTQSVPMHGALGPSAPKAPLPIAVAPRARSDEYLGPPN